MHINVILPLRIRTGLPQSVLVQAKGWTTEKSLFDCPGVGVGGGRKRYFSSQNSPDTLGGPFSLLFNTYPGEGRHGRGGGVIPSEVNWRRRKSLAPLVPGLWIVGAMPPLPHTIDLLFSEFQPKKILHVNVCLTFDTAYRCSYMP
jgi:hypothetical protein